MAARAARCCIFAENQCKYETFMCRAAGRRPYVRNRNSPINIHFTVDIKVPPQEVSRGGFDLFQCFQCKGVLGFVQSGIDAIVFQ